MLRTSTSVRLGRPPLHPTLAGSSCATLVLLVALVSHATPRAAGWSEWVPTGAPGAPPPRTGQSLLLFNDTVFLFGGRGNDVTVAHDPRTFTAVRVNGTVAIESYNSTHVVQCVDPMTGEELDPDTHPSICAPQYEIPVGLYFNDLWTYPLNCSRVLDGPCSDGSGWRELIPGAPLGGCKNFNASKTCSHPSERVGHAAAILYEREPTSYAQRLLGRFNVTAPAHLVVYGGYSQLCSDYCSDMWELPLTDCLFNATLCRWRELRPPSMAWDPPGNPMDGLGRLGPGKRWRTATAADTTRLVMFGGHRMWQGLAAANSLSNRWASTVDYPHGGFLDDLWVFVWNQGGVGPSQGYQRAAACNQSVAGCGQATAFGRKDAGVRELSLGEPVVVGGGAWQQVLPREQCNLDPGSGWASRKDIACTVVWPAARAQAAAALVGEALFLYGGYSIAAYPFPHVLAAGSGPGVSSLAADSATPFPSQPSFYSDLWVFSWVTGLWQQLHPTALGDVRPPALRGHSLVLADSALLLFGGYASNVFYHDLWSYNVSADNWLHQVTFPRPLLVDNCTSAPAKVNEVDNTLVMPNALEPSRGSPVAGEPTRGTVLDGLWGRSNVSIFVPENRRRALGWDGCRDRYDGRTDLVQGTQFLQPLPRAGHASVWSRTWGIMLMFGGEAVDAEVPPSTRISPPSAAVGDLWAWGSNWCPGTPYAFGNGMDSPEGPSQLDCSGHGTCFFGNCYCKDGYFGVDCSNATCPGDFCFYDDTNHVQRCTHCCSIWDHPDGPQPYYSGVRKSPCDAAHPGFSHGICDGGTNNPPKNSTNPLPGMCQCVPPYVGSDCSIYDCPNGCSSTKSSPVFKSNPLLHPELNYCSMEYPNARCMCNPPFTSDNCSQIMCPNNCSYPNGVCNLTTGVCGCNNITSPYNNEVNWSFYGGSDCSYAPAFAGAPGSAPTGFALVVAAVAGFALLAGGEVLWL